MKEDQSKPGKPSSPATDPTHDMNGDFDSILAKLGTGKWNIFFLITMCFWYSQLVYHTIAGVFLAPTVDHTCRRPPHAHTPTIILPPEATHATGNTTYSILNTTSSPSTTIQENSCHFLVENITTGRLVEEPCTEWDFDTTISLSTVTSEFQLVCDKKYLRATYQSMYMFGMLAGSCFNGYLGDKYGRYTLLCISSVTYCVIAIGSAWLPSLPWLFTARFLLGSMHPASLLIGYILVQEIMEPKMRIVTGITQFISWTFATMLYSVWAYLIREWRWLQTFVSLPTIIMIPLLFTIDESPRWLAVVGQHQRALKVLRRAAKLNKVTLPSDQDLLAIMKKVQEQTTIKEKEVSKSVMDKLRNMFAKVLLLFSGHKIRLITFIMCLDFCVVGMLFFGLTMGANALGVNLFIFVAISGTMELPGSTILLPITKWLGRKRTVMLSYFITAVVLLTQPLIPADLKVLSIVLVMIGKMMSTCAFASIGVYITELFPTEVRSQGFGMALAASRLGAIIAPFIISAVEETYPWLISVVFGISALVASIAIIPLWETENIRLPDTLADLDTLHAGTESKTNIQPDEVTRFSCESESGEVRGWQQCIHPCEKPTTTTPPSQWDLCLSWGRFGRRIPAVYRIVQKKKQTGNMS
ncbi:hypothetical protein Pcinc_019682 [Petrolisthes cinctipes]|uniref:Major facilitator superfamily (MFS) profile domain-containing protein n=1 Tax=Petrolisthes cinctipes TaxID=88211 RepID=A0AAE1FLM7_PETCI|nr:hypothetical protein Pcinc_019682 [Petrolisthes cinctipes]